MEKTKLTTTQEKVFNFLKQFIGERGYPPTLREIASYFRLNGPKGPQKTLTILERKGYIRRSRGESRAIEILKPKTGRGRGLPYENIWPVQVPAGRKGDTPHEMKLIELRTAPIFAVPIVGRVTAGEPILAIENIEGYVHLDRSFVSSKNVFLLRVQGDSMIEAHIQDGDFALVRPQASAEDGEIVVVLIEDEATIKRIFQKRDLVRLEPANPTMEPIVVQKGEKKVTIVGKVVGIFRKI